MPLYVMLATSLKDMDEIRDGNLLSLPPQPQLRRLGQGLVAAPAPASTAAACSPSSGTRC